MVAYPTRCPRPRLRTTPDPLETLSRRRFEVACFGLVRATRRVDAVSPQAAKLAGAALLGIHASRLVAVELEFALTTKGLA